MSSRDFEYLANSSCFHDINWVKFTFVTEVKNTHRGKSNISNIHGKENAAMVSHRGVFFDSARRA